MHKSVYTAIDTTALLIDNDIMLQNIRDMQKKADDFKVKLRPHTKTHKMPELAKLQVKEGARGITVAKVGEAEVMAGYGLDDIFIANEIVGISKLERVRDLSRKIHIRIGVDNEFQVNQLQEVFKNEEAPIAVLIELEVGENRSGVTTDDELVSLAKYISKQNKLSLKGVFSHEGPTYQAKDADECIRVSIDCQKKTLRAASIIRELGIELDTVSTGATPSMMSSGIVAGITEIRPGTYIFMDAGQGHAINNYDKCAASVLATVTSKPTAERVVTDAGAKSLTTQRRDAGICATPGFGLIKNSSDVRLSGLYDEHGLINDRDFRNRVETGDKIEIIPNHICPVVNLFDKVYLVSKGQILHELPVLCRGKSQ